MESLRNNDKWDNITIIHDFDPRSRKKGADFVSAKKVELKAPLLVFALLFERSKILKNSATPTVISFCDYGCSLAGLDRAIFRRDAGRKRFPGVEVLNIW